MKYNRQLINSTKQPSNSIRVKRAYISEFEVPLREGLWLRRRLQDHTSQRRSSPNEEIKGL